MPKHQNESKSDFCDRIMREHGMTPKFRTAPEQRKVRTVAEMTAEREALQRDMLERCHERFKGQMMTAGTDWSA